MTVENYICLVLITPTLCLLIISFSNFASSSFLIFCPHFMVSCCSIRFEVSQHFHDTTDVEEIKKWGFISGDLPSLLKTIYFLCLKYSHGRYLQKLSTDYMYEGTQKKSFLCAPKALKTETKSFNSSTKLIGLFLHVVKLEEFWDKRPPMEDIHV